MKLALILLALTLPAFAQTPVPPAQTSPAQTPPASTPPAQTPAAAPAAAPAASTPAVKPPVAPPPPVEKPENHNGPAFKNPKSTLPKVVGIPHVLYSLKYVDLKVGTGPLAEPRKFYTVNYTGWFTDGTKFDSSYDRPGKEPITFPYGAQRVIIGWDTGFEGMRVGGKRRLYVPYQLAYGLVGRPPKMGPKANLIFDVELVGQSDKPPAPAAGSRAPGVPGLPGARPAPGVPGVQRTAPVAPVAPAAPGTPATPPPAAAPATPTPPPATTLNPPTTPPTL